MYGGDEVFERKETEQYDLRPSINNLIVHGPFYKEHQFGSRPRNPDISLALEAVDSLDSLNTIEEGMIADGLATTEMIQMIAKERKKINKTEYEQG